MRHLSSCLTFSFAAFLALSAPVEAAPAGLRGFGHRPAPVWAGRHPVGGRLATGRPGFHGRFAYRPFGHGGFRAFRHGGYGYGYGYGYGSWPLLGETGAVVENTILNQVGAAPEGFGPSGIATAPGIAASPVASPVVYVIGPNRVSRRGRAVGLVRSGPRVVALRPAGAEAFQPGASEIGPRIVSVSAPYGR